MNNSENNRNFDQQLDFGRKLLSINKEEDNLLKNIPSQLNNLIIETCKKFSLPVVDIIPVGSSQRQTYLPGNRDIDIFVRLNTRDRSILEKFASKIIPDLAQSLKTTYEIKYAENPFGVLHYPLPNSKEFIPVDVVATIWIQDQVQLATILPLSGMARTPFHMFYLQQHITGREEEIRLFKYWTKQKKLYRQSGFTGFISELLIIIYGSFQAILTKADEITRLTHDFHGRSLKTIRKKFSSYPVVIIDPVDPNRNAAAGIHGILGNLHLNRFKFIAQDSLQNPDTLWDEYSLTGNVFTLKIEFVTGLTIKNDEEYYSRIIKVLGLIYRALIEQSITVQDAIIDVPSSSLSFTTNTPGGGKISIKGPPVQFSDHVDKFRENNPDNWVEGGFCWAFKEQLTVQDTVLAKIKNPDLIQLIYFT